MGSDLNAPWDDAVREIAQHKKRIAELEAEFDEQSPGVVLLLRECVGAASLQEATDIVVGLKQQNLDFNDECVRLEKENARMAAELESCVHDTSSDEAARTGAGIIMRWAKCITQLETENAKQAEELEAIRTLAHEAIEDEDFQPAFDPICVVEGPALLGVLQRILDAVVRSGGGEHG